jgi:RNA polymerase sigma-70 factor (ECF subfamily)
MGTGTDREDRTTRFERVFRSQYPTVAGYVRRRADPGLVDDLVNEVFLVAWRRLDEVPEHPRPWLLAVARNVLGTHIRGARRTRALAEVAAALAALRPKDCEALMLVTWEGLAPTEAAEVLGESAASFRVRLHRARSRFRKVLEGESRSEPVYISEEVRHA